ncbi:hypothetical protein B0H16DRAFT_1693209 [Mycena metata]|uniref:Uncharacterized protein n=1 Tax=Mycena metata TaxID=1033252 RepID=A0AAD7IKM6_9AGAR|nr:hypothetical protein B0H16DRAFT_1693209 [Mycena metata]
MATCGQQSGKGRKELHKVRVTEHSKDQFIVENEPQRTRNGFLHPKQLVIEFRDLRKPPLSLQLTAGLLTAWNWFQGPLPCLGTTAKPTQGRMLPHAVATYLGFFRHDESLLHRFNLNLLRRDRRNHPAESPKGNANALNILPAESARLIKYREHRGWSAKSTSREAENQSNDGGAGIESANMIECQNLSKSESRSRHERNFQGPTNLCFKLAPIPPNPRKKRKRTARGKLKEWNADASNEFEQRAMTAGIGTRRMAHGRVEERGNKRGQL